MNGMTPILFLAAILAVNGSSYRGIPLYKVADPNTTLWTSTYTPTTYTSILSITECARRCFEQVQTCGAIAFELSDRKCTLGECSMVQPVARSPSVDLYQTSQPLCNSTPGFNVKTNGHTTACLWLSKRNLNFTDARNDCHAKGSILATFKTWEKFQILQQMSSQSLTLYIGLDDMDVEGVFRWHDDGSVLDLNSSYSHQIFKKGQPDNWNNTEDCVTISTIGLLNDYSCYYKYYYVCEKICFSPPNV